MLADIYNWFTDGLDTADLKDAFEKVEPVIDRQGKIWTPFEMRAEMRTVFPYGHQVMNVRRSARSTSCFQLWAVRALLG